MFDLAHAGDPHARDALFGRFTPLARSVAHKFFKRAQEEEDIQQVALLALVKAIDRYDPAYGTAFSSFAIPTISGELKRYFRDVGWGMRVPRALQELSLSVEAAIVEIEPSLGRPPTTSEIATYLRVSSEAIVEALEIAHTRTMDSYDESGFEDEESPRSRALGGEDPGYALVEELATVAPAFAALPAREQEILRLRFGSDMSQREIAAELGMSQMHISRLIRRALDTMAELADSAEAPA